MPPQELYEALFKTYHRKGGDFDGEDDRVSTVPVVGLSAEYVVSLCV